MRARGDDVDRQVRDRDVGTVHGDPRAAVADQLAQDGHRRQLVIGPLPACR